MTLSKNWREGSGKRSNFKVGSTLIVFCHYFSCHYFHKGGEGRANLTNVTNFMGFLWLQLAAFSLKTTSPKDKIDNHFGELKQKFCLSFLP